MSFSFRNIFSPDDSEFEGSPEADASSGFSAPGSGPQGRGNLSPEVPAEDDGQPFLVSELLPLIPPSIVASSGIPMEKEIRLAVPADGSLDVKLSALYQLCPELFAAEITPLNDSVLTLPPRVGAIMATAGEAGSVGTNSIFSKPEAGAGNGGGAFWSPVTPLAGGGTAPVASNPFSSGAAPAKSAFSAPAESGAVETGKKPGGFDAPLTTPGTNAFSAEPEETPGSGAVASPVGPGFFGFSAPPLAKSEGESAPSGNPFESDKGFATLFSKQAEKDTSIPHPTSPFAAPAKVSEPEGVWGAMFRGEVKEEPVDVVPDFESIGNLLSQAKKPTEPMGFSAAVAKSETPSLAEGFAAGFAGFSPQTPPAAEEEASPAKSPAPEIAWSFDLTPTDTKTNPSPDQPMPPASPAFQAPEVFAPAVEDEPSAEELKTSAPEAEVETEKESDVSPAPELSTAFVFGEGFGGGFVAPGPVEDISAEPVETPSPAAFAAPVAAEAVEAVFATAAAPVMQTPVKEEPSAPVAEAVVEPVVASAPVSAPSGPVSDDDDLRDLEMRAIFSTSERFNLSTVARKVVALPGINSCSLSTLVKIVHASRSDETRLGNEAREMIATLRSLAKLTGLPEARTFTLQTDRGIVSLFLEGDCCVSVNQESATFQPGVREKLILIARCIGKIRD